MYRKLIPTFNNGFTNCSHKLKKEFPELKNVSEEEMIDRFKRLKMMYFYEKKKPVNPLIRITLPFALITMILMIVLLPVNFLLTGRWGYNLKNKNVILNWFKSLKLVST